MGAWFAVFVVSSIVTIAASVTLSVIVLRERNR